MKIGDINKSIHYTLRSSRMGPSLQWTNNQTLGLYYGNPSSISESTGFKKATLSEESDIDIINSFDLENDITTVESLRLDLKTVQEAMNNFSNHNKIGEGGFGEVYKV
ncbi:hypothetical protein AgCh_024275 [Apium graveolens]